MKICILTLGCKVNQYESDSLLFALDKLGHEVSTKLSFADVYIINTCAVTNEAERKSRQMVAKVRKINNSAKIFICGCASQKNIDNFLNLDGVEYVTGVANKLKIIEKIDKVDKKSEIDEFGTSYEDNMIAKNTKTRAYIKIQDGCNNFCSYCIIPYLRGRSRSRNIISILNEIEMLDDSVKEIVITGIDISSFKIEQDPALDKLLLMLKDFPFRIRIGSLEQGVVDKNFLNCLTKVSNLCPHFHLSLQSGSNSVLKRMNRHYKVNDFKKTIKSLRKIYNNPAITTDIIVGFPGETEKEFLETVRFVKKIGFADIHIFPYSSRSGTVASKFKQVDGNIKKQRVEYLEKVKEELKSKYIKKCRKGYHSVLIEEREGEFFVGYTENYIKCYIRDEKLLVNSFVNVKIKERYKDGALVVPVGV